MPTAGLLSTAGSAASSYSSTAVSGLVDDVAQDAETEARRLRNSDPVLWREGAPRRWTFLVDVMDENVLRSSLETSGGVRMELEEWAAAASSCDRRLGVVSPLLRPRSGTEGESRAEKGG